VQNRSRLFSVFNIVIDEKPAGASGPGFDVEAFRRFGIVPSAWIMHIGPRDVAHGEAIFWPTRRGRIRFDQVQICTTFPFNIVRKSRSFSQPQHTLIYPMLYELRRGLLNSITPKSLMGTKISQHAGAGDDFYGTRDFRPGDSMRHIAWKRAAKMDDLVTIERTSPSPARLRVVLDLSAANFAHAPNSQTAAPQQAASADQAIAQIRELEERAISLAASIVHAADAQGYEVGLTVLGIGTPPIAVRRNRWHFNKIMAALAEIDLEAPRLARSAAATGPIRDAERAALVVISPDRAHPLPGREDAWYLTARQLEALAVRPLGWDAARPRTVQQSAVDGQSASSRRSLKNPADTRGAAA